jgi:hypothetical protein
LGQSVISHYQILNHNKDKRVHSIKIDEKLKEKKNRKEENDLMWILNFKEGVKGEK